MKGILAIPAALLCAAGLGAQDMQWPRPEFRPFVGAFIPMGAARDAFKSATTVGGQAAVELNRNFHLLGTVSWTHGHNKFDVIDDLTRIWQYDIGAEYNVVQELGGGWMLRPFAGGGLGARTYDYAGTLGTNTCTAGYATLGSEVQLRAVAFRLEAREYLSCFESPLSGKKHTRNDVGISLGVAYHIF